MALKTFLRIIIAIAAISGTSPCIGDAYTSGSEAPVDSGTAGSIPTLLRQQLQNGEAYVWYLLHCGYAVKTPTRLLIFDYVPATQHAPETPLEPSLATGRINPAEIRDLDVYVFVSHSHEDHYDPVIFDWQGRIDKLTYIFGWQATGDSSHYHLVGPRATLQIDGMDVYTVNCRSGVPEVAYLVKTDGLTIFFQGDYKSDSPADIDYLLDQCDTVDMAFLGGHTRRWGNASTRIVRIMEQMRPRVVFPMHYGGKEQTYREFARECAESGLPYTVTCPEKSGDRFHYRR